MPRTGGEADKLGNYYEWIWIADSLLDLISGDATSLTVEPLDSRVAEGIEFVKTLPDGTEEYHSVKRQHPGQAWSLNVLGRSQGNGRSILLDLLRKLSLSPGCRSVFVSQTGANELLELCERARRSRTVEDFENHLGTTKHLAEDFRKYIVPNSGGSPSTGFENLKRVRAVSIEEQELLNRVRQKTLQWVYRPDGRQIDANEVRHFFYDFVINRLAQTVTREDVLGELDRNGYHVRIWATDIGLLARVADINNNYLAPIQRQLINGKVIQRPEVLTIFEGLLTENAKAQMIVGSAGLGKSSIIAQIVEKIREAKLPVICIRLDILPHVLTTEKLGHCLSLPMSPARVLAGIANGGNCVLVIDQLDALSLVSGRNDHLWPVLEQLIREANEVANMKILFGCRAFDLEHDSRLRALTGEPGGARTIRLGPLELMHVESCIAEYGSDPKLLKGVEKELLRVPFNLQIFLQGGAVSFRSLKELFDGYWEYKRTQVVRELNHPSSWEHCISLLAQALSRGESSAPADLFDELAEDAKKMASNGVLVLERQRWRFFHESFGDYAFARKFVRGHGNIIALLTQNGVDQHLFRRTQVRQILSYERDRDLSHYIEMLRQLLDEQKVRLHIKKLTLEWLSGLPAPRSEEWDVVKQYLWDEILSPHVLFMLWGKAPWFDLLHRLQEWPHLIVDPELGDLVARVLGQGLLRERPSKIAQLYNTFDKGNADSQRRLAILFEFGIHYSRELFDLALQCLHSGLFDALDRFEILIHHLVEEYPDYAVEFLAAYLDRIKFIANTCGETNPFLDRENLSLRMHGIKTIAEKVPVLFVQNIAPRLYALTVDNSLPEKNGIIQDKIWKWLTLGAEHNFKDELFFSAARALKNAAATEPLIVARVIEKWQDSRHKTLATLLMLAWSGNGAVFAEAAVEYLVKHPQFIDLGYTAMIGTEGNFTASVSRELLRTISPHLSHESFLRLEREIQNFYRQGPEEKHLRARYKSLLLLRALPAERLSREAVDLLEQLDREFPTADIALPPREPIGAQFVEQTVHGIPFETFTDEDWLNILELFSHQQHSKLQNGQQVEPWNLLGPLRKHAQADPKRFSGLTVRMANDCLPIFFSTILDSIVNEADGNNANLIQIKDVLTTVERLHELSGRPCGQAICFAIYKLAGKGLPNAIIRILCDYAENDSDPAGTDNEKEGKDLVNHGINTVRGAAADAIAQLLFKDIKLIDYLRPTIDRLSNDPSLPVRAVTIHALTALLNVDRESAVKSFLAICENEPRVWGSHHVETFIYYSTFTHYAQIRELLLKMAFASDPEVKKVASGQICLAGFRHPEAQRDSVAILNGDKTNREAATRIYAQNWFHLSIREICTKNLRPLFNDPELEVRRATHFWDNHLHQIVAEADWNLFKEYIASKAFHDEPGICLYQLKKLPTVPEKILLHVADRAIDVCKSEIQTNPLKAAGFSSYTPVLIVRLYHQTREETVKVRCLDHLDAMIAFGCDGAAAELAKSEE